MRARLLVLTVAAIVLAGVPGTAAAALPPIRHVFVIVLENEDAATTFGANSKAPFLARDLPASGLFMPNYYGIGHESLDNYIAMISGQAPNPQTQADCQLYTDMLPGVIGSDGQALGTGCVYPAAVSTIADQLSTAGLTWKGYMEDMGDDPKRDNGMTCAHPAINAPDGTQTAAADDQYATRHNPFVYFHSITDSPACAANDVPLSRLAGDLQSADTTPNLSFVTPDLCHDGHDATCADGGPGGLPAADAFLREWVPRITGAPAFRDGLLIVTFDESASDSSACCGEQSGPDTPAAGGKSGGPGGGRVGAVLVSPYIAPGTTTTTAYNHYSLLRSVEELFALPPLGYAGVAGLPRFGDGVYTNAAGTAADAPALPVTAPTAVTGMPASGTCRARTLRGLRRHVARATLLGQARLVRRAGRRRLHVRVTHTARVLIDAGNRRRTLRARSCRMYELAVPESGPVRLTALAGAHAERRTL